VFLPTLSLLPKKRELFGSSGTLSISLVFCDREVYFDHKCMDVYAYTYVEEIAWLSRSRVSFDPLNLTVHMNVGTFFLPVQGDQIVQIFALWVIIFFGPFFLIT
jgi:hypothetical protein